MKNLTSFLLLAIVFVFSCSDDDSGPKCKFTFQDVTYTSNGGPCTDYGMDSAGEIDGLEWGLSIDVDSDFIVFTNFDNTFIYNSDPTTVEITQSDKTFTFTAHLEEIDIPDEEGTIEGKCTCTDQ